MTSCDFNKNLDQEVKKTKLEASATYSKQTLTKDPAIPSLKEMSLFENLLNHSEKETRQGKNARDAATLKQLLAK